MTPAEILFSRKIRSVFDKLIPNKEKVEYTVQKTGNKFYEMGEKVFFTECIRRGKDIGKLGLSPKESVGWYIKSKDKKIVYKRHLNQTKNRHIDEENDTSVDIDSMEVLFDTFDVPIPQKAPETKI